MSIVSQRYFFILAFFTCLLPFHVRAKEGVTITEAQTLTFPKIGVPSQGSVNLSISPLNSSISGTAQIISGSANRGQYNLSLSPGGNPTSISIDITGINSGNAGLTLNNFRGYYQSQTVNSFPSPTLPLPAKSPATTPLYLGATLTANPTVPTGNHTANFSITVFTQ